MKPDERSILLSLNIIGSFIDKEIEKNIYISFHNRTLAIFQTGVIFRGQPVLPYIEFRIVFYSICLCFAFLPFVWSSSAKPL